MWTLDPQEVVIRRFQESDASQIKELFRSGMLSLIPNFYHRSLRDHRTSQIVWCIAMVVLVALALAHQTKYIWIAGLVAGSWAGYMRFRVVNTMVNYVNRETHENLADIEATYFKREGTFLVAIDNSSGRIVGMVGGDNKGKGVLELRRMSVDLSIHSKGLGTRIVHELENFARKNGFKKILLYCTTGQYAANRLYQKTGFELLDLIPMSELPGTHMCHYEKNLMK